MKRYLLAGALLLVAAFSLGPAVTTLPVPVAQWSSPVADEPTIHHLQHLREIEGLSSDAFAAHFWFDPIFGDDTAEGTFDAPFRSFAFAKRLCQQAPHTRCTVKTIDGHAWFSPLSLTLASIAGEFYAGEAITYGAASEPARVLAWIPDPAGAAPGCVAAPCSVLVIAMDHPPGWPALCSSGDEIGAGCDFVCTGGTADGDTCIGAPNRTACTTGGGTCGGVDSDCDAGVCGNEPDFYPTTSDAIATADARLTGVVIDAVTDTLHSQVPDDHTWGSTVTGGDTTHVNDGSAPFTPGALVGKYVFNGNNHTFRTIVSNTSNSLEIYPALAAPWNTGDPYKVGVGAVGIAWQMTCPGDPEGACVLFEADRPDALVHIDANNEEPEDPSGGALMMISDQDKTSPNGWMAVQGVEGSRCLCDVFSTGLSNGGGVPSQGNGGKMLTVRSGGDRIVNINLPAGGASPIPGAENNNTHTTHGNGWIVALNNWGTGYQDSDISSGSPIAPTGSGGLVMIGHRELVARGDAYTERLSQSGTNPSIVTSQGGDTFILGHVLRCGGSPDGQCIDFQMGTSTDTNPSAGDEAGSSIVVVRVRRASWVPGVLNRWRTLSITNGNANRYVRFEGYGLEMGGVGPFANERCVNVGNNTIRDTSPPSWFKLRGATFDECETYFRDVEGVTQTALYLVDFQQSAFDPDDAGANEFCAIGGSSYDVDDCRLEANNGSTVAGGIWRLFDDAESVDIGGVGVDKTAWKDHNRVTELPQFATHADRTELGASIGPLRIELPGDEAGFIPAWALGTSQSITALNPDLYVGVR